MEESLEVGVEGDVFGKEGDTFVEGEGDAFHHAFEGFAGGLVEVVSMVHRLSRRVRIGYGVGVLQIPE